MAQTDPTVRETAQPLVEGLRHLQGEVKRDIQQAETQIAAGADWPIFQRMEAFMPAADLLFGGAMLLIIVFVHASGVRLVTNRFQRRLDVLRAHPSTWKPDLHMIGAVVMLLVVHLLEIYIWAAALVGFGLIDNWRVAGFIAANTYTAVGYGTFDVPEGWKMLQPFLALSGLFTVGWSVSVLVEIVRGSQEVKAAAIHARRARRARRAKKTAPIEPTLKP
jgi:hypothetical protein